MYQALQAASVVGTVQSLVTGTVVDCASLRRSENISRCTHTCGACRFEGFVSRFIAGRSAGACCRFLLCASASGHGVAACPALLSPSPT
eukprot:12690198-Alexandrium_andersonii.AAC.1